MSRKSFTGSQKGWMTLLIASLLAALLIFRKKTAISQPVTQAGIDFNFSLNSAFQGSEYPDSCRENWAAVSKMETSGWTSSLFKNANNPWGMTFPTTRKTTASGVYVGSSNGTSSLKFARYDSLDDGCEDIIDWMDYWKFPKTSLTLAQHVQAMGNIGYYGKESYDSYYGKVVAWLKR